MSDFDVNFDSVDAMIRSLADLDLFGDAMQAKLLNAAADDLVDLINEEGGRSGQDLGGILKKVSKAKKIKSGNDGSRYTTVTITGKNSRGERYATVVFVLNYGRSKKFGKITGSYFWTRAARRAQKTVLSTYEDIVSDALKERNLI